MVKAVYPAVTRWSASVLKVGMSCGKSEHAVRVAKLIKQDWPIVLH